MVENRPGSRVFPLCKLCGAVEDDGRQSWDAVTDELTPPWISHMNLSPFLRIDKIINLHHSLGISDLAQIEPSSFTNSNSNTSPLSAKNNGDSPSGPDALYRSTSTYRFRMNGWCRVHWFIYRRKKNFVCGSGLTKRLLIFLSKAPSGSLKN